MVRTRSVVIPNVNDVFLQASLMVICVCLSRCLSVCSRPPYGLQTLTALFAKLYTPLNTGSGKNSLLSGESRSKVNQDIRQNSTMRSYWYCTSATITRPPRPPCHVPLFKPVIDGRVSRALGSATIGLDDDVTMVAAAVLSQRDSALNALLLPQLGNSSLLLPSSP